MSQDEDKFEKMVEEVLKVTLFTGAETGASCLEKLTNNQLDALISHKWPNPKEVCAAVNPIQSLIQDMQDEKSKKLANNKNEKHNEGFKNSRDARISKVLAIGKKLRTEGENHVHSPLFLSHDARKSLAVHVV